MTAVTAPLAGPTGAPVLRTDRLVPRAPLPAEVAACVARQGSTRRLAGARRMGGTPDGACAPARFGSCHLGRQAAGERAAA